MSENKISPRALSAWVGAALIPTWIQNTAGKPWIGVLAISLISSVVMWAVWRWGRFGGKLQSALCLVFTILALGTWLGASAQIWPGGNQYPAVPLIITALAAWSALKGPRASAAVGCVLFWGVLAVYLLTLSAGMSAVDWKWISPTTPQWSTNAWLLGLLPCAVAVWKGRGRAPKRLFMTPILNVWAAVVTLGVLSPILAAQQANPFLELSRSISLLGQVRRFEAVISAGMTVGWFCLASILINLCAEYTRRFCKLNDAMAVVGAALVSSSLMLWNVHISEVFLLVFGSVCWGIFPFLSQGIEREKKS